MEAGVQVQDGDAQPTWEGTTWSYLCMADDKRGHANDASGVLEHGAAHQEQQGQRAQLHGQVLAGHADSLHQGSTHGVAGGSAEEEARAAGGACWQ
eukprot:6370442-Heterocapsa_arctica.AAC.1